MKRDHPPAAHFKAEDEVAVVVVVVVADAAGAAAAAAVAADLLAAAAAAEAALDAIVLRLFDGWSFQSGFRRRNRHGHALAIMHACMQSRPAPCLLV